MRMDRCIGVTSSCKRQPWLFRVLVDSSECFCWGKSLFVIALNTKMLLWQRFTKAQDGIPVDSARVAPFGISVTHSSPPRTRLRSIIFSFQLGWAVDRVSDNQSSQRHPLSLSMLDVDFFVWDEDWSDEDIVVRLLKMRRCYRKRGMEKWGVEIGVFHHTLIQYIKTHHLNTGMCLACSMINQ